MNWQKYCDLLGESPELGPCFSWHIGPGSLKTGSHPDFDTMREWVERQVEFVAIRPFESLDLGSDNITEPRGPRGYSTVTYTLWFHIAGKTPWLDCPESGEMPCYRSSPLNDRDNSERNYGYTIEEKIEHLLGWWSLHWALKGYPLVLDAIVRHSKWQRREDKYVREALEIFRVPADFLEPLTTA